MGFFRKRTASTPVADVESPVYSELNDEHKAFLANHIKLADQAEVDLQDPVSVAEFYELVYATWQTSPDGTLADLREPYCNAAGVAYGELLVRTTPLRWVIAEDSLGREMALHAEQNNTLVYPLNAVEKRWAQGDDGDFIPVLAGAVYKHFGGRG
ncbi:DUF3806 domain-containing protein [Paenarthrobacter nitroguajacolicus]|uniref:DUF3806 domain-containing protein n=1 Tax=Paenarthrobacter nitroguajacolicus TaxID=211146 RepID=UPI00248B52CE|nr:DUF3806 domain-containing protein [Paenarthrobacter nitroguajacolicus]MDI2036878.1 hypothetical protein [Paenarthrobacter nitroguajacolicus]